MASFQAIRDKALENAFKATLQEQPQLAQEWVTVAASADAAANGVYTLPLTETTSESAQERSSGQ